MWKWVWKCTCFWTHEERRGKRNNQARFICKETIETKDGPWKQAQDAPLQEIKRLSYVQNQNGHQKQKYEWLHMESKMFNDLNMQNPNLFSSASVFSDWQKHTMSWFLIEAVYPVIIKPARAPGTWTQHVKTLLEWITGNANNATGNSCNLHWDMLRGGGDNIANHGRGSAERPMLQSRFVYLRWCQSICF